MKHVPLIALLALVIAAPPGRADDEAHGPARDLSESDARAGKPLYLRECSGCHGERGDGAGPAADFVDPRPRDFTKRLFKLRTTPSGQPPTTADVLQTIARGIPGTAMPSFAFLPEAERRQIAAYVLELADLLDEPEPRPVADPGPPPPTTPESVARGKQLYADAGCGSCHGEHGRGDGDSTKDLKDSSGRPIRPRDFTAGVYRGGAEPRDLYYRIATGMDGTPMPAYGDALGPPELWAVVDYVRSLGTAAPAAPLPADPLAAGRAVAAKYSCAACHVLDDGKGGEVGPDLRLSGRKLHPAWVQAFLKAPREYGKIYPWRVYRMPQLPLSDAEIAALTRYLALIGKQPPTAAAVPDVAKFPADRVTEGATLFVLRCAECHNLGTVVETPLVKQQGPDLIAVARRVDYDWAKDWILDPKKIDPKTRMVVPGLTAEQVDAVRMFLWKTSLDAAAADAGGVRTGSRGSPGNPS
ncbi:MAG TPA: c-type cytochrome [Candidatus Binatia bacterium]|nr:c-type cytochrome [Candidatus Binatia bacterium]